MWSSLMDQLVSVQRATVTQDAGGGEVQAFADVATNVTASVQSLNARTVSDYARRDIRVTNAIYSTYDFDTRLSGGLATGDRIIDADGIKYVVVAVNKDRNRIISPEPLYKIICERPISG